MLNRIKEGKFANLSQYWSNPDYHAGDPDTYFQEINNYTWERFKETIPANATFEQAFAVMGIMPPLHYKGKFIKGLVLTSFADSLVYHYPDVRKAFNILAYARHSAFPWSEAVDGLLYCFEYEPYKQWFLKTYPERSHLPILVGEEPDWIHESHFRPLPEQEKIYDLANMDRWVMGYKNLAFIADVLLTYTKKYDHRLKMLMPIKVKYAEPKNDFKLFAEKLGSAVNDHLVTEETGYENVRQLYAKSRITIQAALLEGKPRTVYESILCNTPVVVSNKLNHWTRGNTPIFPEGCGLTPDFDPEAFADAIHTILTHYGDFQPRENYLSAPNGRKWTFHHWLSELPYYQSNLPLENTPYYFIHPWLELAAVETYQKSLHDCIYEHLQYLPQDSFMQYMDIARRYGPKD